MSRYSSRDCTRLFTPLRTFRAWAKLLQQYFSYTQEVFIFSNCMFVIWWTFTGAHWSMKRNGMVTWDLDDQASISSSWSSLLTSRMEGVFPQEEKWQCRGPRCSWASCEPAFILVLLSCWRKWNNFFKATLYNFDRDLWLWKMILNDACSYVAQNSKFSEIGSFFYGENIFWFPL